jgi:hypothetical protein
MWSGSFWKQVAERAAKSAAQALIGLWALDAGFNVLHADWALAAGVAGGAAVLSALTSILSATVSPTESPSLVDTRPTTPGHRA